MASNIRPPSRSPFAGGAIVKGGPARRRLPVLNEDLQAQDLFTVQIMRYLRRLPPTLPMPCTTAEAYFGLVPDQIRQWYDKGLFSEEAPLPGKAGNLLHTMMYTFEMTSATASFNPLAGSRHTVLHVSVESQEDYVTAMHGGRGHEKIFWLQAPQFAPLPRNSVQTPFWLPLEHPYHTALMGWYDRAEALQKQLDMAKACMAALDDCVDRRDDLRKAWPEIISFLHMRNEIRPGRLTVAAIKKRLEDYDLKTITDMLATATLLPEKPEALGGWVGFYSREG